MQTIYLVAVEIRDTGHMESNLHRHVKKLGPKNLPEEKLARWNFSLLLAGFPTGVVFLRTNGGNFIYLP